MSFLDDLKDTTASLLVIESPDEYRKRDVRKLVARLPACTHLTRIHLTPSDFSIKHAKRILRALPKTVEDLEWKGQAPEDEVLSFAVKQLLLDPTRSIRRFALVPPMNTDWLASQIGQSSVRELVLHDTLNESDFYTFLSMLEDRKCALERVSVQTLFLPCLESFARRMEHILRLPHCRIHELCVVSDRFESYVPGAKVDWTTQFGKLLAPALHANRFANELEVLHMQAHNKLERKRTMNNNQAPNSNSLKRRRVVTE